jgi:biopolymer transport protein ExbD
MRLIDKYGRIQLLGDPLSLIELQIFARNALTYTDQTWHFFIFADENAEYHDIQPVLNLLKDEGFGRIRMAVQDEDHNLRGTRVDISDIDPSKSQLFITVE